MSKLADLRNLGMVGDPFLGGLGRLIAKGAKKLGGAIKGVVRGRKPAVIEGAGGVLKKIPKGVAIGAGGAAVGGLAGVLAGAGGGAGAFPRRRGRGITSRELRGFRKVTNLLRKVGMVPKGLGRRKKVC